MKRFVLILSAALLLISTSHAQLRVGILAGGHQSSVMENNNLPGWDSIKNNYPERTGFHGGFIADLRFSSKSYFYFQPAIMFNAKGRKYVAPYDSVGPVTTYNASQYVNYIDMPLNIIFKYPIAGKLKFMAGGGPYLSFFYNGREKSETQFSNGTFQTDELEDLGVGKKPGQYKIWDYGVNATAGIEYGRVFLTANYSRGLSDFYTASYEGDFKHEVMGATLGVFLGKQTELEPKVKDRDKDGIPNEKDLCPDEPGTAATNGCPDKDGDGIADKEDKCIDVAGISKYNGCPVPDADKDGINDEQDKCPNVPGLARYNGCPVPDTDKDGVNDEEDKCPSVAGIARYQGCPVPDTDGDGINDEEDKCPTTAGIKENNGCPEIKKEIIEKVNVAAGRIQFEAGKAKLLASSNKVLDGVIEILNQHPDYKLTVEGHSSSDGNYDANVTLSQQRAEQVKKYFVSKGVDAERINAIGYGPDKPLNEGKAAADRAANRRVELKLSNQ